MLYFIALQSWRYLLHCPFLLQFMAQVYRVRTSAFHMPNVLFLNRSPIKCPSVKLATHLLQKAFIFQSRKTSFTQHFTHTYCTSSSKDIYLLKWEEQSFSSTSVLRLLTSSVLLALSFFPHRLTDSRTPG